MKGKSRDLGNARSQFALRIGHVDDLGAIRLHGAALIRAPHGNDN
jgi:hypothetical protein